MQLPTLSVSDFVALLNQTMEAAFPSVTIEGEVSSFRVSKGRWVYFDLKDEHATVRFFGSVYQLNTPIEDGMLVKVRGTPRLHPLYNFSVTFHEITPSGEGSLRRAFELLLAKLKGEGLFDESRKRPIPEMPERIGLITSGQAAAYADFMRILGERWGGVEVLHADVQVQGEAAPGQIVRAIQYFNQLPEPVDVLVITRGGGSLEDLMAFSTEDVARAVAGSRTPTVVGVGHETDTSLADLAADLRAATPSNAAQLIVPDRRDWEHRLVRGEKIMAGSISLGLDRLESRIERALTALTHRLSAPRREVDELRNRLCLAVRQQTLRSGDRVRGLERTLGSHDPRKLLRQGYSIVRTADGRVISHVADLPPGARAMLELSDGTKEVEAR